MIQQLLRLLATCCCLQQQLRLLLSPATTLVVAVSSTHTCNTHHVLFCVVWKRTLCFTSQSVLGALVRTCPPSASTPVPLHPQALSSATSPSKRWRTSRRIKPRAWEAVPSSARDFHALLSELLLHQCACMTCDFVYIDLQYRMSTSYIAYQRTISYINIRYLISHLRYHITHLRYRMCDIRCRRLIYDVVCVTYDIVCPDKTLSHRTSYKISHTIWYTICNS